ncbi:DNA polymerase III subunit delta' [Vagococcus sp. JNUCC 83]
MTKIKETIHQRQPLLYKKMTHVFREQTLSHAYIIQGNNLTEEKQFALYMCQGLFCEEPERDGSPCGKCRSCLRIEQDEHADIANLEPDGQTIKVDQIRQTKSFFTSSGVESRKKVLIISESEKMTVQSANSLLKFIEEPDGQLYIFFLTHNAMALLPTIQSRCQIIVLKQMPKKQLKEQLKADNFSNVELLVELTNSVDDAHALVEDEWFEETKKLLTKWLEYFEKKDSRAFLFVQQYLLKHAQDKNQQRQFLEILIAMMKIKMRQQVNTQFSNEVDYVKMIMIATESKQKLASNVSFQNTCEQLALRIMTSH